MDKKINLEKYGMVVCPVCDGYGRIRSPDDVKVCQNCGGSGLIRKEGKIGPAPEVPETVNHNELGYLRLTSEEEDDIVALLRTLTDGYSCRGCR
jgi:DnaJ-class molecular chaperone